MKLLKRVKYPKFLLLIITVILAYVIFSIKGSFFEEFLTKAGYFGTYLSGMFLVYGFTAAPALAAILILAKQQNILLVIIICSLGSLVGDLIIFRFIRLSFSDEIEKFEREKFVKEIEHLENKLPHKIKKYLLSVFAGFIIASPLPDEVGIPLLASSKRITFKEVAIISFILHTIFLTILLLIV